jgi:hypothetical protein
MTEEPLEETTELRKRIDFDAFEIDRLRWATWSNNLTTQDGMQYAPVEGCILAGPRFMCEDVLNQIKCRRRDYPS